MRSQRGCIFILLLLAAGCKDFGHEVIIVPPGPVVSFQKDIKRGIFDRGIYGCTSCHGGNGNLIIDNVAGLLRGGDHGPAVVPGSAATSNIILKLSPNPPFGDRMPQGGAPMLASDLEVLKAWINQGAMDN